MKRLFIWLGVLLVVTALGVIAWNSISQARAAPVAYNTDELVTVARGTLIATVSATGSIQPEQTAQLAFLASGNVSNILVTQGESVKAGQPLVRLDTAELELQVAQADANLALAESKLEQTRKGASDSAIAAAQANLNSANAAYNKLLHPDVSEVAIAHADVTRAKVAVDQAQAAYDRIGGATNPNIALTPQSRQLQEATIDYQRAVDAYNAKFKATDAQRAAALAQIQQAKDQLARLTPTSDEIAQAQANANASRAARDIARQRLDQATLYAPFDGTITRLDLNTGDFVQTGRAVVTLADLAHLRITLNIDETDIPRVVLGQTVALDLDAFPNRSIDGRVVDIAPSAATVQGVVNYEVKVQLLPTDVPVKLGMTTNASIEVARKEDVLLVPNRAIRAVGNRRMVTLLQNGATKDVELQLGLSNDQETEVLSGLSDGQQVVTTAVPSNVPSFGGANNSSSK